jgi:WXG100 family type VII secretion target
MVQFRVRAESLDEVAALLQQVIAAFDSSMATTRSQVSSVVNASWRGPDADTFEQTWTQFEATSVTVRSSLSALSGALAAASVSYNQTEGTVNNAVVTTNAPVASLAIRGAAKKTTAR